jgi:hypothetical protein
MRVRFRLLSRYKLACLGFGSALGLLFWIPCGCQIVLLPVGAAGAAELVWTLVRHDPELVADLREPSASVLVDGNAQ